MREAIGGTWLFGLVITFIVFFASFLAISVNYSRAFNVKNNIVDIVSKYEGNNCNTRKNISDYFRNVGYLVTGTCDSDYIGYDLSGNVITSGKSYYCIKSTNTNSTGSLPTTAIDKNLYEIEIFFKIDLPLINQLTEFKIKGQSEYIFFAKDDENDYSCF